MASHSYESIQTEIARLQKLAKKMERRSIAAKNRARRKVFALMKKLGLTLIDLADGDKKPRARKAKGVKSPKAGKAVKATKATKTVKPAKTRKRRTSKVAIKYRGPGSGETWTGRGLTPRWLAAQIAEGKKKEDFLIVS